MAHVFNVVNISISYLDVLAGSREVEAARLGVVVPVTLNVNAGVLEDGGVVPPRRLGQIHDLFSGVPKN